MVNVSVKAPDIVFQTADINKTAGTGIKTSQSDEFKKLLQGKQDDGQENSSQEVSKDTKPDQAEASKKPDEGKDKETEEGASEDAVSTDDSQARGLLAAYQMDNGLRPELLTAEPEVVIEMPEGIQADMEIAAADFPETMTAGEMTEQANVQTEAVSETDFQAEVKPAETVQVKASEAGAEETESSETAEAVPVRRETVNTQSAGEENQAQTDDHQAQQSAAASAVQTSVRTVQADANPQEVTTVHVAQPEELPDKLTDQILGKMQEGVQSFEIEIEPENLGKIAVKIMYEDGQATVSILCTEKKALDVLGNHAREIGGIIDRNLGGETKIFVEKQEPDYLNQNKDENQHGKQDEQGQQKESHKKQDSEDSEQFLQKLRLGLTV